MKLLTYLVGLMQLLICICTFAREIPHQPAHKNYPTAPWHQRAGFWVLGLAVGYFGVETIQLAAAGERYSRPSAVVLTAVWLYVAAVDVEGVLRRWLPARLQARVQRFFYIASCRRARQLRRERERNNAAVRPGAPRALADPSLIGSALAELTLAGVRAIGPLEGPEAIAASAAAPPEPPSAL